MLDTKENAYAIIEAVDDSLNIDGFGREPDRKLPLPDPIPAKKPLKLLP